MDEQNNAPIRRRRPRRPKWQRMILKYWPPIRTVLLALIVILLIALAVTGVIKLARGTQSEKDEQAQSYFDSHVQCSNVSLFSQI